MEQSRQLWGQLLFAILVGTYLAIWLQQVALKLTSAAIAQTLMSTSPLFVLPFAAWTGERVTVRAVAGAAVALVGIGLLFG
jgi:drug/metabolite transporter (DMT)-like permease